MGIKDDITNYIKHNNIVVCDDCLTRSLQLSRRQVAYQYCTNLQHNGVLTRDTTKCDLCLKYKKCSWVETIPHIN